MASVVNEFVHVHAANQRGGALFGADEIDRQQENEPGENCPWQPFTQRNDAGGSAGIWVVLVIVPSWGLRVPTKLNQFAKRVWLSTTKLKLAEYSGATAPDFHRLPHFATTTTE